MTFNPTTSTALAAHFSSLHRPSDPLLLTNIWDPPSTLTALSLPQTTALATASFAIAASLGLDDDFLTLDDNLAAITLIRRVILADTTRHAADTIPLSVDLQDGYGDRLVEAVEAVVKLGVVGVNLEDALRGEIGEAGVVIEAGEMAERIRTVIETAERLGVKGFVVNARTDVIKLGGTVEEAVERGKVYLAAGATTVFVWGYDRAGKGKMGLRDEEVREAVRGLDGRVAVVHRNLDGFLGVKEIAELGVARISMGPGVWKAGQLAVEKEMRRAFDSAK